MGGSALRCFRALLSRMLSPYSDCGEPGGYPVVVLQQGQAAADLDFECVYKQLMQWVAGEPEEK